MHLEYKWPITLTLYTITLCIWNPIGFIGCDEKSLFEGDFKANSPDNIVKMYTKKYTSSYI
jgi:hypothetical protein